MNSGNIFLLSSFFFNDDFDEEAAKEDEFDIVWLEDEGDIVKAKSTDGNGVKLAGLKVAFCATV